MSSNKKFNGKVTDYYKYIVDKNPKYNPNKEFGVPCHSFRMAIVGRSGSRKSTVALSLIEKCACFTSIYLICKQPDEALYEYLAEQLKDCYSLDGSQLLKIYNKLEDIPKLDDDFNTDDQTLFIIDDMITEPEKKLKEHLGPLFIRGRKKNVSTIIIVQNWYSINKLIRNQLTHVIFKDISSKKDKNMIAKELGVDSDKVIKMIDECQREDDLSFFMIDLTARSKNKRYSAGGFGDYIEFD